MNYKKLEFQVEPYENALVELLIARLSENSFEAFQEEENAFSAYIKAEDLDTGSLEELLADPAFSSVNISFSMEDLPDINWNTAWEKSYNPILMDDICAIIAPFHSPQKTRYNILIEPKMSFGTGHHETTRLMIRQIYAEELEGKRILDMGCGTGVLGIFCLMRGAGFVSAIDIDEWACTNSVENFRVNHCLPSAYEVLKGEAASIPHPDYDVILANINRNILLEDMNKYISRLKKGGILIISGLLYADREVILEKARLSGISFTFELCENNWISLKFIK